MKDKLKGKMVKTKRDKISTYNELQLECPNCFWETTGESIKINTCPDCGNTLIRFDSWKVRS